MKRSILENNLSNIDKTIENLNFSVHELQRNVSFSENFAQVLNEGFQRDLSC